MRRKSRLPRIGALLTLAAAGAAGCFDDPAASPHPCDACLPCQSCVDGPDGPTCEAASHQSQACVGSATHWLDSCGADEGVAEVCPEHSTCESAGGAPACVCVNHWTGAACDVCPGNWDPAQDCAACATNWEGDDCESCPGNWDQVENCDQCWGFFDEAADCETCLPGWVGPDCDVCRFYVDIDSPAETPTGATWETAFTRVQTAVDAAAAESAVAGGANCAVWVAEGVYYQYVSSYEDGVVLSGNVALYGGFDGTEPEFADRDWISHVTVLSGADSPALSNRVTNVVTILGLDDAEIDGFTISDGNAFHAELGDEGQSGAGVYIDEGAPIVRYCTIENNSASEGGAGLRSYYSNALIYRCTIANNHSENGAPGAHFSGGSPVVRDSVIEHNDPSDHAATSAVLVGSGCDILFDDCVFRNNDGFASSMEESTGGLGAFDSELTIENCLFFENDGAASGAVRLDGSTALVINSVFDSNTASTSGVGAIDCNSGSDLAVLNCTFFDNYGYAGALRVSAGAELTVRSSVFWHVSLPGPEYQIYGSAGSDFTVHYSDVLGGSLEGGNIVSDPLFVDPESGDFHLQSMSPCIDAAYGPYSPSTDFDGNPRVDDPATPNTGSGDPDYVDMGAFEFQP
jgi:hypothetical protein